MKSITLVLDRRSGKNQGKLQKLAFMLAGVIFAMNLLDYSSSVDSKLHFFNATYFSAYLLGSVCNIAAAIFYDRIKSEKFKDNVTRWLNALTGLLLLFDAARKFALGKTGLPIALTAAGLLYLLISYYWMKIKNRKILTVSDEQITFRRWWFATRKIPFHKIRKISLADDQINISLKNGKSYGLFLGRNEETILSQFGQVVNEINKKLNR